MNKNYQKEPVEASALAVPERVGVVMSEIAGDLREGLLALAVGAGLQVMTALMAEDVSALCGPKGRHDPDRVATRHGSERGSVTLGGRRLGVTRPRVRAVDGSGELSVASYELFSSQEILGRMALERMLGGLSTRRYQLGLEPVGAKVSAASRAMSRSAVSRRFVAMTEHALADLLAADLSGLDLVAIMIDGVHFTEHVCVVALGIDIDGTKHPLALVEGSTENATLVTLRSKGACDDRGTRDGHQPHPDIEAGKVQRQRATLRSPPPFWSGPCKRTSVVCRSPRAVRPLRSAGSA